MLRNRSRAVTSKQALMADHTSQSSPKQSYNRRTISSFFGSPRFRAFTSIGVSESDFIISPTSILDVKPLFALSISKPKSPQTFSENKQYSDPKGIGLALVDKIEEISIKPRNKNVVFASELKIQIPPTPISYFPSESPNFPCDCGSKTRTLEFPGIRTGVLSPSEMALSEDYTCVISHGPNPKTTHIYDNYIVETQFSSPKTSDIINKTQNFLSFCFTCKKNLEQKNDIYIYRGEKAFCSPDCRYQEMLVDGAEKTEF